MNILALDPGGTTGCAQHLDDGSMNTFVCHTPPELFDVLKMDWDIVVYERFASSVATSSDALKTIELCGAIQGICHIRGVKLIRHEPQNRYPWLEQAATLVKAARKEARQPLGRYAVHEYDAMAHLLCHLEVGENLKGRKWGTGISTTLETANARTILG